VVDDPMHSAPPPGPANVVLSNFVSARSLRLGLASLGEELYAFDAPGFMVPSLPRAPRPGDRMFFTDEHSLGLYLGRQGFRFAPNQLSWPLDDKVAFAEAVAAAGGDPVPALPIEALESLDRFPVLLKGRRSWLNGRPHPRGTLCRSAGEAQAAIAAFAAAGYAASGFCLQAWIGDGITNCWSVAGWHNSDVPGEEVMLVTRKLGATRGGLGYALLVGTMEDPAGLVARTRALLLRLGYTGPFELEFLQNPATGRFHELEINPRFWLQHSMLGKPAGYSLLRRYLGLSVADDGLPTVPVLWVSGIGAVMCMIRPLREESRRTRRIISEWKDRGACVLIDPPVTVAVRLLAEEVLRRLSRWRLRVNAAR
jgi:hypothetical protein